MGGIKTKINSGETREAFLVYKTLATAVVQTSLKHVSFMLN